MRGNLYKLAIILVLASIGIVQMQATTHAQEVPTEAEVIGSGMAPEIECAWQLVDMRSGFVDDEFPDDRFQYGTADDPNQNDDDMAVRPSEDPACSGPENDQLPQQPDNVTNMIQVRPNPDDAPEERLVQLWAAVDHPNGISNISDVSWRIYFPDGEFTERVTGRRIGASSSSRIAQCDALGSSGLEGSMLHAAVNTGQVSAASADDANLGLAAKCQENEKAIYHGSFSISKDDPAGKWRIETQAVGNGSTSSKSSYIDVIPFFQLEIDFDSVIWGQITPGNTQVFGGDLNFGTSSAPTVKNTGNVGMGISVRFHEMVQQDADGPARIQQFDGCFGIHPNNLQCIGEDSGDPIIADPTAVVMFGPERTGERRDDPRSNPNDRTEPQVVCSNQVGKLDLSVHPPETVPVGTYRGKIEVLARSVRGVCWQDQEGDSAPPVIKPYAVSIVEEYEATPLLSSGDRVPETSSPNLEYQMVGIPDGLGAHANDDGTVTLYMNHEFNSDVISEPVVGGPLNKGAIVSKWILDGLGNVLSGERAYDTVYTEDTLIGPAAQGDNETPGIARLCSGYLAGPHNGFTQYIYFAGEESSGSGTFSGLGGEAFAFFNNEAHALPGMGRFAKENVVVMHGGADDPTVVMVLEDGPSSPDSQLYMYVGEKDPDSDSVLEQNGLVGGTLYVFASTDSEMNDEEGFQDGSITGEWVEIPDADALTDEELEEFVDSVGAFGFVRIEDGAFSKNGTPDFFFDTTGGNADAGNELGRLYHIRLDSDDAAETATLTIVYNADDIIDAGGDTALSPDNLEVSENYIVLQEDGTTQSRVVFADKGRDGSIWRFDLNTSSGMTTVDASSAVRIVELDPPGRDGVDVGPGVWETSGIIDTSSLYGEGSWLFDVQAHSPTAAPGSNTVEDGQLLLLRQVIQPEEATPIVIGHRGASGYRPEHTLAAYELAIAMGADYIEPDLVSTSDGVLVARHENEISGTTDVADRPEFADRMRTRTIDGLEIEGWFTEDFTLAELKTLRAKERLPEVRPGNTDYDGMFEIPTLQEVIDLAQEHGVGIYPETKHPTYFDSIGLSLEEPLVEALEDNGYDSPDDLVYIQSFEVANLRQLDEMTDLPLVQLLNAGGAPYDFVAGGDGRTYADMATPAGLADIAAYADGIGVNKNMIVPRDSEGNLLDPTSLIDDAHDEGLIVHAWTFRNENVFLPADFWIGDPNDPEFLRMYGDAGAEHQLFLGLGLDGVFTDQPDTGVAARDEFLGIGEPVAFQLTILHNNDGESQLIDAGSGLEDFGGVARFKTLADDLKDEAVSGNQEGAVKGVIMLSSGDNFLASPEFNASLEKDELPYYDTIAADAIGYDAMAIGNHEFDFGPDVLANFIDGFTTDVPFLSANLDFSNEAGLQALVDEGRIAKSTIVMVDGEQVGVIGATTPLLPSISSPRDVIVDSDVAGAVQAEVDFLDGQGVNKIILISHLQSIQEDIELALELSGVDIMIAGGGDELLANEGDLLIPGDESLVFGPYPMFATDADGNDVPVVTTTGAYRYIGRLIVEFDDDGSVTSLSDDSGPVRVAGGDNEDAVEPDEDLVNDVVNPVSDFVADLDATIVGVSGVELDGRRSTVRTMESNEGNLIADALLWQANELADDFGVTMAQVGLQNGGGIRNDTLVPAGDITELDVFGWVPFANFVAIVEDISPEHFKEILENAVSRVEFTDGRFSQIAGFRFVWDPTATPRQLDNDGNVIVEGERVTSVMLDDGTMIIEDGEVVEGAPSINIATIDFLARGGDQHPYGDVDFTVLGVTYQQATSNYIGNALDGVIAEDDYPLGGEGRIVEQIGEVEGLIIAPDNSPSVLAEMEGVTIFNGGFGSGMSTVPGVENRFYLLTDRGPNFDGPNSGEKIFPVPDFTPTIGLFELVDDEIIRQSIIPLRDADGNLLSGLPNPEGVGGTGETPLDLDGNVLALDDEGLDPEDIVAMPDGTFWVSDEYGPHIVHFDANGNTIERINPFGSGEGGRELPAVLGHRRANRGMEGLTITPDGTTLAGIMQSSLDNPNSSVRATSTTTRIVTFNIETGDTSQYIYHQEIPGNSNSAITALSSTRFLVLERDGAFAGDPNAPAEIKSVFEIDISGATDVTGIASGDTGILIDGMTLEQISAEDQLDVGIVPVSKTLVLDLLALPVIYPHDKAEGIAVIDENTIAVINDDDFGVTDIGSALAQKTLPATGEVDHNVLWVITLDEPLDLSEDEEPDGVRFATFNASLNRSNEGDLVADLSNPTNAQAQTIAEIIQRMRPDVLLINEFDFDDDGEAVELFQDNYLSVSQNGAGAIDYPYTFTAPSNTGVDSGFDLNNDGNTGTADDAFGFGFFPGQFGMAVYSRYPIDKDNVRTFQNFPWKDMPGALLPDDPNTPEPNDWYSSDELDVFRLSSKSHWDVPINVDGETVHFLVSHPTPPVFDGEEDRNGKRNHDEIRFWADYIDPTKGGYITDDNGMAGGLPQGASFVIAGDQNADPFDGDDTDNAIMQLLDSPYINTSVTPTSEGGPEQADLQGDANDDHIGDPEFDTADFADNAPGNLRADYVLPSRNIDILDAGIFWPLSDDPLFPLVGTFPFPGSDHRLVWIDVEINEPSGLSLSMIGRYDSGIFDESAAEIVDYDPATQRLFVVNANEPGIDVLDASDPFNLTKVDFIDATDLGTGLNSVSVAPGGGVVAAAIEGVTFDANGVIAFFDTDTLELISSVEAGVLPDMITFTPDGNFVLTANEGEPNDDYDVDPEGSITLVDVSGGFDSPVAVNLGFTAFNDQIDDLRYAGVRIFGPNATVAQDVEPEYVAVSPDSTTAWVSLQENNAFAVVDIVNGEITEILPLGFKDYSLPGNAIDASNEDDGVHIANWPVLSMYLPDAIAAFEVDGSMYIISANEGDARDYDGFSEEERVEDLTLDPTAFPNAAELQAEENLGRLVTTNTLGDMDDDGDFDVIYSFGARSFTIWDADANVVFDSGDDLESITAVQLPEYFNSNGNKASFDSRSDDKGPEPEAVVTGEIGGSLYAFVGLERTGGVAVYEISDPAAPTFVTYVNNVGDPDTGEGADVAPEGLKFIPASSSPNGSPMLVVSNEVSGTTTIYKITQ